MSLHGLEEFVRLVTHQALEAYLQDSGWTIEVPENAARTYKRASSGGEWLALPTCSERESDYYRQRNLMEALDIIARHHRVVPSAVLYDLLPEDRRADLVRTVFPKLEIK